MRKNGFLIGMILAVCCLPRVLNGQDRISVTVYNNSTLLPPRSFYAIANQPLHPGLSLSVERSMSNRKLFHSVRVGAYVQQLAHAGIQLYYELGRRGNISGPWDWDMRFAAGYLHMFSLNETAELVDGEYSIKRNTGRPQVMFGPSLAVFRSITTGKGELDIFLQYQVWMQAPFVPGYVPLLPNGSLHVGISRPVNRE